jgi:hypothetical protein
MICRTYFRTLWFAALLFMLARGDSCAVTSAPYKILQNVRNAIIWQEFDPWLMVTEDCATGRICWPVPGCTGTLLGSIGQGG